MGAKQYSKRWESMTEDERKAFSKMCYQQRKLRNALNPEKHSADRSRNAAWKRNNKSRHSDHNKACRKKRIQIDPGFRAVCNLRNRFKEVIGSARTGGTKNFSALVGCTSSQLCKHLESSFTKGMTWKNYGSYWHVDHIIPCASFDHTDPKQRAACWHWTNLQPMEAKANMKKSNKIENAQMSLLLCASH